MKLLRNIEVETLERIEEFTTKELQIITIYSLYEMLKEIRKLTAIFYDTSSGNHNSSSSENEIQPNQDS